MLTIPFNPTQLLINKDYLDLKPHLTNEGRAEDTQYLLEQYQTDHAQLYEIRLARIGELLPKIEKELYGQNDPLAQCVRHYYQSQMIRHHLARAAAYKFTFQVNAAVAAVSQKLQVEPSSCFSNELLYDNVLALVSSRERKDGFCAIDNLRFDLTSTYEDALKTTQIGNLPSTTRYADAREMLEDKVRVFRKEQEKRLQTVVQYDFN
jgi:hypothetical protein